MYEVSALQPKDESVHEEEWPLFELGEACVTSSKRGSHELVDLLEVNIQGPFRVKGRLRPVKKDQKHLVLQQQVFKQEMTITNVCTYSLEAKEDGNLVIWALGNCGWYALSPSAEYKSIFRQMVEKAKLWLWYEERYPPEALQKKKKIKDSIETLYSDFTGAHPKWPTRAAAEAFVRKHHRWMILKMTEGINRGVDWTRTPLYQELFRHYKNVFAEIGRATGHRTLMDPSVETTETKSDSTAVISRAQVIVEIKGGPVAAPAPAPATRSQKFNPIHRNSKSHALFEYIERHCVTKGIRPQDATTKRIIDICFAHFDWESRDTAVEVIKARAEDLKISMEASTEYLWANSPALGELQELDPPHDKSSALRQKLIERSARKTEERVAVCVKPFAPARDAVTPAKAPTKHPVDPSITALPDPLQEAVRREVAATDEEDNESEEEDEEEEEADTQPKSSKGKSVLRPRVSEIFNIEDSSPLASHGLEEFEANDEEIMVLDAGAYDRSRQSSILSGSKRGYDEEMNPEKITKRLRTLHAQSKKSETKADDWPELPSGTGKPPIKVRHYLPTTTNNPGEIWMCSIQGCNHRVLEANTMHGRKLIEAHYEQHGRMMQEAMEVIGLESNKGRNVDHLLAKLENMAKEWANIRP